MIARFFPCFKGAFGKISTIFLACWLSTRRSPEGERKALWNYANDQYERKVDYGNPQKLLNETIFVLAKIQTFLTKYNFCVY